MRKTGIYKKCEYCGKEFYVPDWWLKRGAKFCSRNCCGKVKKGSQLSEGHKKKIGNARIGEKHPLWKGGKYKRPDGVIMIYNPNHPFATSDKRIREHRLMMEAEIGRYLKPREVVHHIDGDRSNNEINNLMLFPNQNEHMRFERANK